MFPEIIGFIEIKFLDILDILLVAFLLYALYNLLKGTVAINIFFGIVAFYLLWKLVTALDMRLLSEIFGAFISVGFIALIVVFQPEIRKFLLMLGTPGFMGKKKTKRFLFWRFDMNHQVELDIDPIIIASRNLAESKTGALIIIANKSGLEQYVATGKILEAEISDALIENIFFKNSPLHDGAMIIHNNKIKAVGCILPVSVNKRIPANFGLRHRAAIGITEQSDAQAIIISEETGKISYSAMGTIKSGIKPNVLKTLISEGLA